MDISNIGGTSLFGVSANGSAKTNPDGQLSVNEPVGYQRDGAALGTSSSPSPAQLLWALAKNDSGDHAANDDRAHNTPDERATAMLAAVLLNAGINITPKSPEAQKREEELARKKDERTSQLEHKAEETAKSTARALADMIASKMKYFMGQLAAARTPGDVARVLSELGEFIDKLSSGGAGGGMASAGMFDSNAANGGAASDAGRDVEAGMVGECLNGIMEKIMPRMLAALMLLWKNGNEKYSALSAGGEPESQIDRKIADSAVPDVQSAIDGFSAGDVFGDAATAGSLE